MLITLSSVTMGCKMYTDNWYSVVSGEYNRYLNEEAIKKVGREHGVDPYKTPLVDLMSYVTSDRFVKSEVVILDAWFQIKDCTLLFTTYKSNAFYDLIADGEAVAVDYGVSPPIPIDKISQKDIVEIISKHMPLFYDHIRTIRAYRCS